MEIREILGREPPMEILLESGPSPSPPGPPGLQARQAKKIPAPEGLFEGAQLPTLNKSHSAGKCPEVGDHFAYFKGKVDKVKVDLMVIEGDRDPHLRGAEAKQLARITDPALQESSIARGGRPTRYLWVTQGYNLPCQLLAQAVHTMGTDLEFLKLCYLHALNHVRERGFQTVSFSLLGTKQMPTLNCSQGCPVSDLCLVTRRDGGHR